MRKNSLSITVFCVLAIGCVATYFICAGNGIWSIGQNIVDLTGVKASEDGYFDGTLYFSVTSNESNCREVKVSKCANDPITVEIPDGVKINGKIYKVTSIGDSAFYEHKNLKSVTISDNVTRICSGSFENCIGLKAINIPSSVTDITGEPFDGCENLPVIDGIRYADTYLIEVIVKDQSSYSIKEGTRFIGGRAFMECENISQIEIPDPVISIGVQAFFCCNKLHTVVLPKTLESIGDEAFAYCAIKSIVIPKSVTSPINGSLFDFCNLDKVEVEDGNPSYYSVSNCVIDKNNKMVLGCNYSVIPNSVTSIGEYAFCNCDAPESITVPPSVTTIESGAFFRTGVESISFCNPNTIIFKDSTPFSRCSCLESITFLGNPPTITGDNSDLMCIDHWDDEERITIHVRPEKVSDFEEISLWARYPIIGDAIVK